MDADSCAPAERIQSFAFGAPQNAEAMPLSERGKSFAKVWWQGGSPLMVDAEAAEDNVYAAGTFQDRELRSRGQSCLWAGFVPQLFSPALLQTGAKVSTEPEPTATAQALSLKFEEVAASCGAAHVADDADANDPAPPSLKIIDDVQLASLAADYLLNWRSQAPSQFEVPHPVPCPLMPTQSPFQRPLLPAAVAQAQPPAPPLPRCCQPARFQQPNLSQHRRPAQVRHAAQGAALAQFTVQDEYAPQPAAVHAPVVGVPVFVLAQGIIFYAAHHAQHPQAGPHLHYR